MRDCFDRDFHDFDILTKKVWLTLRTFSPWLPEGHLADFAAEVRHVLKPRMTHVARLNEVGIVDDLATARNWQVGPYSESRDEEFYRRRYPPN